jgi:hypothetical protein
MLPGHDPLDQISIGARRRMPFVVAGPEAMLASATIWPGSL